MRRLLITWLGMISLGFSGGLTFPETTKKIEGKLGDSIITTDFDFSNKTDKAILIKECQPSCSCVTAGVKGGKMRYEPGESGIIRTGFDIGAATGTVDKQVAIFLEGDGPTTPSATLKLDIHIPIPVLIEPKSVKWDIGADPAPQKIAITIPGDEPIHVKTATSSNPNFKCELKTVEDGRRYEMVVTPEATKTTTIGTFSIETDCKLPKYRTQQAFGVVKSAPGTPVKP